MTLPFRRRHHDSETTHDRAHSLLSSELLEPLAEDEAAWLGRHLTTCAECRQERDAWHADRELLRSLRDTTPEPPRDLWARTAAALDREASRRPRGAGVAARPQDRARSIWRSLPYGAAAGALVVLVVVATSIFPRADPTGTPGSSQVGVVVTAPPVGPTPIAVPADQVTWLRATADGSWEVITSDVDAVCPRAEPRCVPPLAAGPGREVPLGEKPSTITLSPNDDQLVVTSPGDASTPGRILIVPVPTSSQSPTEPPPTPTSPTDTLAPATPDPASPSITPEPTPAGQVEIATGVAVVGELAYSANGQWLAFSARPSDGSAGPDLYLWRVGDPTALAVTSDHQTYFSAWLGNQVLASRIVVPETPAPSGGGPASLEPSATVEPSPADPSAAPTTSPAPIEGRPVSFLLDPATQARADVTQPDVWLPVVDPTSRFAAYWSGTLTSVDGLTWQLGTGELVLDGWSVFTPQSPAPAESPDASAEASPEASPASGDPEATPAPVVGPTGAAVPLVDATTASFKVKFDPTGTRLGVWVTDEAEAAVGRLHLVVIDPETGAIDAANAPLSPTPALRRFSIEGGRLAWVSPSGQDGQESSVQVLAWTDQAFGEIKTFPAKDLFILR